MLLLLSFIKSNRRLPVFASQIRPISRRNVVSLVCVSSLCFRLHVSPPLTLWIELGRGQFFFRVRNTPVPIFAEFSVYSVLLLIVTQLSSGATYLFLSRHRNSERKFSSSFRYSITSCLVARKADANLALKLEDDWIGAAVVPQNLPSSFCVFLAYNSIA